MMRQLGRQLIVLAVPLVACGPKADNSAGTPATGETSVVVEHAANELIPALRSSLRAVASAQEAYWAEYGHYASDLDALVTTTGCTIADNVSVRLIDVSANGWAMEARHRDWPGNSCVQWYGKPGAVKSAVTAREGKRGEDSPGRVVCDSPQSR